MALPGSYIFVYKGHFLSDTDHQGYANRDPTPNERLTLDETGAYSSPHKIGKNNYTEPDNYKTISVTV